MPIVDSDIDTFTDVAKTVDENLSLLFLTVFHSDIASLSSSDFRAITKGINRKKLAESGITIPRV